ncbi:NAD-dependent epimerase/dehydratase [Planoprotostelium fungivorum]|nr:NAD-dependent epimerase/dehydratase [Planoprotostelium fungivorum]
MLVFVTGASGFVGSQVVRRLLEKGHSVLALARSDVSAQKLEAQGIQVHRGNIEEPESLRSAVERADGVIHCAFNHENMATRFAQSAAEDLAATKFIGELLKGSNKPFIITHGLLVAKSGIELLETDAGESTGFAAIRAPSDRVMEELAHQCVRSMVVRLPPSVHGEGDKGFVPALIGIAKQKGVAAYVGDGSSHWAGVNVKDAAAAYVAALEKAPAGSRIHVVNSFTSMKEMAELIGRKTGLPVASIPSEKAGEHFGFFGHLVQIDLNISTTLTKKWTQWEPENGTLLEDMEKFYF